MGSKLRLVRNVNQSRRFRFVVLIVGCFVVTMTFLVVSKPQSLVLSSFGFKPSSPLPQSDQDVVNGDDKGIQRSDSAAAAGGDEDAHTSQVLGNNNEKEVSLLEERNDIVVDSIPKEETSVHELTETGTETDESGKKPEDLSSNQDEMHSRLALPTVSNYTINDRTQADNIVVPEQSGQQIQTPERKPLCDVSDQRTDVCEMSGDIRIPGSSSSVIFMESSNTEQQELWHIRPYPRKGDGACLSSIRELTVKASSEASQCTVNHDAPAVVFSIGGYAGNPLHDFIDLLVPLFLTARQFDGEVQLVVTDYKSWWITKYFAVLQKLSKYPVIDFDNDKAVHCFKHVVAGLKAHNEFQIDPARAPNGYTMLDFTKFMRSAFSLERETLLNIEDLSARKPRLLIISRKQSRVITNINEIAGLAEELGYEVVLDEADAGSDLARFARIVNSCDVMMGVYGSGLTNLVFLPLKATLIQIVPWGGLEWMAAQNYGNPAKEVGLNYVQYSIAIEESTLTEQYPRDHPVFTDPASVHSQGFHAMRSTFMDGQNVKLDVKKFREVLWKTLEHLIQ